MNNFKMVVFGIVLVSSNCGCGTPCPSSQGGAIVPPSHEMCAEYSGRFDAVLGFLLNSDNPNLKSFNGPEIDWSRWTLMVNKDPSWKTNYGNGQFGEVAGVTYCDMHMMTIGHDEPKLSALCHEMVHAIQGCVSGSDDSEGHKYWGRQDIYLLIDECQAAQ